MTKIHTHSKRSERDVRWGCEPDDVLDEDFFICDICFEPLEVKVNRLVCTNPNCSE